MHEIILINMSFESKKKTNCVICIRIKIVFDSKLGYHMTILGLNS